MLILPRHIGESIVISHDGKIIAEVTFVEMRSLAQKIASIGVTAPRYVAIHRREVWDAIQRDALGQAAAAAVLGGNANG